MGALDPLLSGSWRHLTTGRAVLAAALLALALSMPSIGYDFVYDDVGVVADREALWEGGVAPLVTEPYWPRTRGGSLWRPATLFLFSAQWSIGDGDPAVFHGMNVLLYALVSGLVALLASLLFTPAVGLASGLLFAAHPVHVEVTANVVGQAELLSAAAYVGALLLAWRAAGTPTARVSALSAVAVGLLTLLGITAKEHVVTLPGALLVLWWLVSRRNDEPIHALSRRQWPVLAAMLLPIGLYLAARVYVLGDVTESGGLAPGLDPDSALQRLGVMLPVSLHWLRLLFWPVHLSAEYGPAYLPVRSGLGGLQVAAAGLWLAILAVAWRLRDRVPALAVGVALFFVTISVVSSVVVPLEIRLAERFLFLPSVGWTMAVGGLAAAATARPRATVPVAAALAVVILLLSLRTLDRLPVWSENDAFFAQMERDAPGSFRISWLAAEQSLVLGDTARAEHFMREAVQRNPYQPEIAEGLALLLMRDGRHAAAIPFFIHALERDLERRASLEGLSISLIRTDRGLEALRWLNWLEELHGTEPLVVVLRIEALRLAGRFRESVETAEEALEGRPDDWNLHLMAAESARLGGLCERALRHVEEGRLKAPEHRREDFDDLRRSIDDGETQCG
jgi:protein O-mannosyl-transferase